MSKLNERLKKEGQKALAAELLFCIQSMEFANGREVMEKKRSEALELAEQLRKALNA